ncbi:hypothetical protein V5O48_016687, partial [Marasmius crinis-equi]
MDFRAIALQTRYVQRPPGSPSPSAQAGVERAPDFKYEVEKKNYWGDVVELVEETRDCFLHKDQTFVDGLLLAEYPRSALKFATTTPPALEKLLASTQHPLVRCCPLPHPEHWSFEDGEEVIWAERGSIAENRKGTFLCLVVSGHGSEPQTALVSLPDGVFPAKTRELLKLLRLGDWVLLRKGKHWGRQGCVVGKRQTSIEVLLPDQKMFVSVHVNSAKRIPPPEEKPTGLVHQLGELVRPQREPVPIPWCDAEVRVTRGPLNDSIGIVETVEQVEGRMGRKLLIGIWIPVLNHSVFVDYDNVVHR